MMERVYNFSPGPAVLPLPVLEQAQRELVTLPGVGMSILEISHRSPHFERVLAEAKDLLRQLLDIPEGYTILMLQGGASLQFSMVPINFLRDTDKPASYIITGTWGSKALQEAKREGEVQVAWDGKAAQYSTLPRDGELKLNADAAYVHMTSNETIQGVQFQRDPQLGSHSLICDASSDFLSRPIDVARYAMIYACAQKNAGIAGVTAVIVREALLERAHRDLPSMLDYRLQAKNDSLYNTPPVFGIYILMLIGRWLRDEIGGLAKMADINRAKAGMLYDVIDSSGGFYVGHAQPDCRSAMNVTFRLPTEELEQSFVKLAKDEGLYDLKGHRSVGGIRASIYNAMPVAGVEKLRDFMKKFKATRG